MNLRDELAKIRSQKGRVLVVGLGISGIEAARFLARAGITPIVVEREAEESYRKKSKLYSEISKLRELGAELHFGTDGEKVTALLDGVTLAVLSPGVSLESAVAGTLRRYPIRLVGELELGVELRGVPALVVTGSNGKSTTVNLMHAMLMAGGFESTLCGNIGTPVIAAVDPNFEATGTPANTYQVVEASSYQLEICAVMRPKIAALLNVSDNHLERHGTMERYLNCKARIFENQQREDFALLNYDDARVRALAPRLKAQIIWIGQNPEVLKCDAGALIKYDPKSSVDAIHLKLPGHAPEEVSVSGSPLMGAHNRYNFAFAFSAAKLCGVPTQKLLEVVSSFKTLEHRLEFIPGTGRLIINDSKSTTVAASVAALQAVRAQFPERHVVVMLGGLAKAGAWDPLMQLIKRDSPSATRVICFGQDASLVASHCRAHAVEHAVSGGVADATAQALGMSRKEDLVLFSPGCASFDEFRDFEERGAFFKRCALESAGAAGVHP
ncbi:MAG: UDP-N-acetylmuramoyl-L-alanine--D-glutamate ligase [Oligoflexia bacterium]|nr:UDP-N-acetylmuramoyl-L-alanine--D-glutamate ligase [Oligoflexia bacterium]